MSTCRIPAEAGFVAISKMPRGPRGFPLCRKCGAECRTARNTFCSGECVHEWKLRTQPGYAATHVLERDAGVCALCRLDTLAVLRELKALRTAQLGDGWDRTLPFELDGPLGARCDEIGLPPHLRHLTRRLWEMDHTTPVVEGGGSCGLENLRTLCWACHRAATAALAKRRAAARKATP